MNVVNCESHEEAQAAISNADAFFGKLTPELLQPADQLRWVQSPTASLEHYLFPELMAHPCQLSNMRGLFSDAIAEHVFGYILCITRNLHIYLRQQQERRWEPVGGEQSRHAFASGPGTVTPADRAHRQLADCSIGVIGVGEIGAEICRRAASFGMTIYGVDPIRRSIPDVVREIWPPQRVDDLLSQSDFVVIAAPHTPETEKLFRLPRFQAMKREAWLINIGRGAIVDLEDLTTALDQELIAGAALDVFETEPLPPDHPLWARDNVIITPHVAGMSPRIAERHLETLLENCRRFVRGEDPITLVDKSRWY